MPPDNPIGQPFVQLAEVQSSNNYAMGQAKAQLAGHGATWFANHQTAGKGQRGKTWQAEPGKNITMSFIIEPSPLLVDRQFDLSAAIAVACFDFFNSYTGGYSKIKWPNDIFWKDRKAGGILVENSLQGSQWKYAIVGIGLNINQTVFQESLKNPVSLKQITGKTYDVIMLAQELCRYVEKRWQQLLNNNSNEIFSIYQTNLYKLGERVQFKKDNALFTGIVKGVNSNGELLVDTGAANALPLGSVEWLLP